MASGPAKKIVSEKNPVFSAGKFFLLLIVFFGFLRLLEVLISTSEIEIFIAKIVAFLLGISGIANFTGTGVHAFVQLVNGPEIVFSELCTGLLETQILVAAILATFEIGWKKRILGAIAGIIAIFLFNLFRILVTIGLILSQPVEVVELSHEILFRLFLFAVIAGFYWLFLRFAKSNTGKETGAKEMIRL